MMKIVVIIYCVLRFFAVLVLGQLVAFKNTIRSFVFSKDESIIDNFDEIAINVERTLSCLDSTDFDSKDGLNEASLKAILVAELCRYNYEICSELQIGSGFSDLVLCGPADYPGLVIIELKYVRLGFLKTKDNRQILNRGYRKRESLKQGIKDFNAYSKKHVLSTFSRISREKSSSDDFGEPIYQLFENAKGQVLKYCSNISKQKYGSLHSIVFVGVANKIYFKINKIF